MHRARTCVTARGGARGVVESRVNVCMGSVSRYMDDTLIEGSERNIMISGSRGGGKGASLSRDPGNSLKASSVVITRSPAEDNTGSLFFPRKERRFPEEIAGYSKSHRWIDSPAEFVSARCTRVLIPSALRIRLAVIAVDVSRNSDTEIVIRRKREKAMSRFGFSRETSPARERTRCSIAALFELEVDRPRRERPEDEEIHRSSFAVEKCVHAHAHAATIYTVTVAAATLDLSRRYFTIITVE